MNMNSCPHTEKILEFRLGLLTGVKAQAFKEHLDKCPICQRELQLESAIEKELSMELNPGFIEEYVRARVQAQRMTDMRSFWLYTVRVAIYGVVAAISGLVVIPLIMKFLLGLHLDLVIDINNLSRLVMHVTDLTHSPMFIIGFSIILLIASSIYLFAYMRE
jgi:hypothetical protein